MIIKNKIHPDKSIIRKCHCCGELIESRKETQKCPSCRKSFLPLNYFDQVHNEKDISESFSDSEYLQPEDLIIGLYVIW